MEKHLQFMGIDVSALKKEIEFGKWKRLHVLHKLFLYVLVRSLNNISL